MHLICGGLLEICLQVEGLELLSLNRFLGGGRQELGVPTFFGESFMRTEVTFLIKLYNVTTLPIKFGLSNWLW